MQGEQGFLGTGRANRGKFCSLPCSAVPCLAHPTLRSCKCHSALATRSILQIPLPVTVFVVINVEQYGSYGRCNAGESSLNLTGHSVSTSSARARTRAVAHGACRCLNP
jgi:hypothetical protein